jgi:ribonuclease HI
MVQTGVAMVIMVDKVTIEIQSIRKEKISFLPFQPQTEKIDYKVSNLTLLRPQIPVGGRLRYFLTNWKKITTDQWVLSLIKEGYKMEFQNIPPFSGIKTTSIPQGKKSVILLEINSLLSKNAIEIVPKHQQNQGFYSTLFLVPKKNGQLRPVINLRPLNKYLVKKHFKMDTLAKVINLVRPRDWAVSIDLSDAYLHIPIYRKHRKFLRFCFQGICYQWKVMCFGPSVAPRVFTKLVSVVAAYLRTLNIRLSVYLDDWMSLNQVKQKLIQDRDKCLNLLISLGFIVNNEKSSLAPQQSIVYIGALFNLKLGLISPTWERIKKIQQAIENLVLGQRTARDILHLLGLMASCIQLIPYARLHMRPIQLHLLSFWKPINQNLNTEIPFTQHLRSHLFWWQDPANTMKGRSLIQPMTHVNITTDASKTMYGAHMENSYMQGVWTPQEQNWHINSLEMQAVILAVKHFLNQIKGKSVLIKSDNTTVVQYINKQGGTKSSKLCIQAWNLWKLAIQNNVSLKSVHIPGVNNCLADHLSRHKIRATEWTLNRAIVHQIFQIWDSPMIDLFASENNHQLPIFCTWFPSNQAYAIDALTISWENLYVYAFPPICMIPQVLKHFSQYHCQMILIAPNWQRRHWFTDILNLLVAEPIQLPVIPNLLVQPKTQIYHPNPQIFNLVAWKLSTNNIDRLAFLNKQESCLKPPVDRELGKIMTVNSECSVAGVVQNKLIRLRHL